MGTLSFLILLLLLVQAESTLKQLYVDIFGLIIIILLWPFTSPVYFKTDNFFLVIEQFRKDETFFDALLIISVLFFLFVLIDSLVLIEQCIHERQNTTLGKCIFFLCCEYLILDIFKQYVDRFLGTNYGNNISQTLIHINMYFLTFSKTFTSKLLLVYIYLYITGYLFWPISTMMVDICSSLVIVYEFKMNYESLNSQTFAKRLWKEKKVDGNTFYLFRN